jgi:hypothetical protein
MCDLYFQTIESVCQKDTSPISKALSLAISFAGYISHTLFPFAMREDTVSKKCWWVIPGYPSGGATNVTCPQKCGYLPLEERHLPENRLMTFSIPGMAPDRPYFYHLQMSLGSFFLSLGLLVKNDIPVARIFLSANH